MDLSLLLLDPRLLNDFGNLRYGLNNNGRRLGRHLGGSCNNVGDLDGALLELLGELLVQEIANDENCDDGNDVENVEGGLGGDLLDNGTLGMVDDWGAHY